MTNPQTSPLLLAIDFETTGLNTEECEIIEFGYALFDEKNIYSLYNRLVKPKNPISKEIEEITGITNEILQKHGENLESVFMSFMQDIFYTHNVKPDYFVGHNSFNFDEKIFKRILREIIPNLGSDTRKEFEDALKTNWIDTSLDIPYPVKFTTRKLTYLLLEHGYFIQNAHRALFDCLGCVHLFQHYGHEKILKYKNQPTYKVVAQTVGPWVDGGQSKDWCKSNGFRWNSDVQKWIKVMKEEELNRVQPSAPVVLNAELV